MNIPTKKQKKKWSDIVREERDKGNVIFLTFDAVMVAQIKNIVNQPVDGLLYDLNRDEATALSFMDRDNMQHWVNNFAVALVIRELKSRIEILENLLHECNEEMDGDLELHDSYLIDEIKKYFEGIK